MRDKRAILVGVLGALATLSGRSAGAPASPCLQAGVADRIVGVTDEGEIRLGSGRIAALAGLRLPDEPALRAEAVDVLKRYEGREAAVAGGAQDRWGRVPARLMLDEPRLDLAHALLEQGFALVSSGEADALCGTELLAIEATAREQGLGLWAGERYKPVAAADVAKLQGLTGSFALVEGRVRSVGERRQRRYLNFGADWTADFTITIPKRSWARMQERGLSAAALRGRRVRARGVIEAWQGPALEIVAPEMLEILDEDRGRYR